jgi:hypothetical protein
LGRPFFLVAANVRFRPVADISSDVRRLLNVCQGWPANFQCASLYGMYKTVRLVCVLALSFAAGCQQSTASKEPDGFEIAGHDIGSGRYTILERMHASNGRYIVNKIVALCKLYQWGSRPPVNGPDACDLPVGRMYRTNLLDSPRAKGEPDMIVDFVPGQAGVSIQEGSGQDKTSNYLAIESISVARETTGSAN